MSITKNLTIAAAATLLAATSMAQSVHNTSQASALSAAGLSSAVAFVPMSVTIGGSALASMTMDHLSRLMTEQREWIVHQVRSDQNNNVLTLQARKAPDTFMQVQLPANTKNTHTLSKQVVHFNNLAPNSFALMHETRTLGVLVPANNNIGHSVQR